MKKIMLGIALIVMVLTGCSGDATTVSDSSGNIEEITTYNYTDPDTGCEYIIFDWYQGGGASPKLDSKGQPTGCRDLINNSFMR